jgi:hypothetical protein
MSCEFFEWHVASVILELMVALPTVPEHTSLHTFWFSGKFRSNSAISIGSTSVIFLTPAA